MRDTRVTDGLKALQLVGMAAEYERQEMALVAQDLPYPERIMQMIHAEIDWKADRRSARLLKASGLNPAVIPERLHYGIERGMDRSLIAELCTCQFIRLAQNVTIVGATGNGKTFLGSALGRCAIRQGIAVRYYRAHRLVEDFAVARLDGSIRRLRAALRKVPLLILDEFGLFDISDQGKEELLDVLEDRAGTGSTIVIGQLSVKEWHDFIGTPLLADAILDRILCRSYNIELTGESMRVRNPNAAPEA